MDTDCDWGQGWRQKIDHTQFVTCKTTITSNGDILEQDLNIETVQDTVVIHINPELGNIWSKETAVFQNIVGNAVFACQRDRALCITKARGVTSKVEAILRIGCCQPDVLWNALRDRCVRCIHCRKDQRSFNNDLVTLGRVEVTDCVTCQCVRIRYGNITELVCTVAASQLVQTGTTGDQVIACSTVNRVICCAAVDAVVTSTAINHISACTSANRVITCASQDGISTCTGADCVIAVAGRYSVVAAACGDVVITGATNNIQLAGSNATSIQCQRTFWQSQTSVVQSGSINIDFAISHTCEGCVSDGHTDIVVAAFNYIECFNVRCGAQVRCAIVSSQVHHIASACATLEGVICVNISGCIVECDCTTRSRNVEIIVATVHVDDEIIIKGCINNNVIAQRRTLQRECLRIICCAIRFNTKTGIESNTCFRVEDFQILHADKTVINNLTVGKGQRIGAVTAVIGRCGAGIRSVQDEVVVPCAAHEVNVVINTIVALLKGIVFFATCNIEGKVSIGLRRIQCHAERIHIICQRGCIHIDGCERIHVAVCKCQLVVIDITDIGVGNAITIIIQNIVLNSRVVVQVRDSSHRTFAVHQTNSVVACVSVDGVVTVQFATAYLDDIVTTIAVNTVITAVHHEDVCSRATDQGVVAGTINDHHRNREGRCVDCDVAGNVAGINFWCHACSEGSLCIRTQSDGTCTSIGQNDAFDVGNISKVVVD